MPRGPQEGERKVFFNRHMRGRAAQRILEHTANRLGALVVRQEGNVLPIQRDGAGIGDELARNGVEQCRLARAVGSDNRGKVTVIQVEIHTFQRGFFIDRAGVEGLADILQIKHGGPPPFRRWRGGA